ncbi:MAG: hypothetical protein M1819_003204 [Sarea resinae]|nr:MAG: hypothetical protein M1819_003204 [Sarea resinae]
MHFTASNTIAATVVLFASAASSLNIIVNNDDGFASANIREFYRLLNAAGHNAWIVAPISIPSTANLTTAGDYDIIPEGAPSFGTDPTDDHIWYFDGTPAACTFFALDYVVPNYWNGKKPDLVVGGPNFGDNAGPVLYTLSGTIGGTYSAVSRGYPGIAFSAGNTGQRSYKQLNKSTASGYPDPATIAANLSTNLVNQIAKAAIGKQLLPDGYGLSVNYPVISSLTDTSCISPPFYDSRITGGASVNTLIYSASSGTFSMGSTTPAADTGTNSLINGNTSLTGENAIVSSGCQSSVSVFTIDYDAPDPGAEAVFSLLLPLVGQGTPKGASDESSSSKVSFATSTPTSSSGAAARSTKKASAASAVRGSRTRTDEPIRSVVIAVVLTSLLLVLSSSS